MTTTPNLAEWRERAEFWASRDPETGLYDRHAVAFAKEVVTLLDRLRAVSHERDAWRDQVVAVRGQQRDALRQAQTAKAKIRAALNLAETWKANPLGSDAACAIELLDVLDPE